jgi:predicted transcriptional regulator
MKIKQGSFIFNELKELSLEIKKRRIYLGLSQSELAHRSGLSQSIIAKVEQAKVDPTFSTLLKIEKTLSSLEKISNRTAKDIMVREIISVSPKETVKHSLHIMRENDFSQLLVMDKKVIVGVIYESSLLGAILENESQLNKSITSFLEPAPITVPLEFPISNLSSIFQNKQNKCVLVQKGNEILGIITKSDIFKQM